MRTEFYRHENGEWRWRYLPVESPEERTKRWTRNSQVFWCVMLGLWLLLLGQEIWEGKVTNSSVAMVGSQIALALGGLAKKRKVQIAFAALATVGFAISYACK